MKEERILQNFIAATFPTIAKKTSKVTAAITNGFTVLQYFNRSTIKILKNSDAWKFAIITLKYEQCGSSIE